MHRHTSALSLLIALSLAGCEPAVVLVNGNCNGQNNCNNTTVGSSDSDGTGDPSESESESSSTTAALDLPDPETETESTETETETETESTETDTGETETGESDTDDPDPGLPGCGNGLPFPGDLCYLPFVYYEITNARDAALGDMNGDEHTDVVVITPTIITLYLGNGSGMLVPSGSVAAPVSANDLSLGDVDADGDLDVAINGSGTIERVYFNNGVGVLATFAEYFTYNAPRETLLADLDNDGDLDLAHAHSTDRKVVVRKNNGLGSFGAQVTYDIDPLTPTQLTARDMDDDGAPDLVLLGNTPLILYNYGNGTFDGINEQVLSSGGNLTDLAVADFDLDGHLDIAGPRQSVTVFRVTYGLGQRMFDPMTLDFPSVLVRPSPVISDDFDVDGIPDLATSNDGVTGQAGIHRGDGAGAFYDAVVFAARPEAVAIMSGDLNEDGVPDIVAVSDAANSAGLSVLLSNP